MPNLSAEIKRDGHRPSSMRADHGRNICNMAA
jgi:hypothetical protein